VRFPNFRRAEIDPCTASVRDRSTAKEDVEDGTRELLAVPTFCFFFVV
jgi:hypothetical protein